MRLRRERAMAGYRANPALFWASTEAGAGGCIEWTGPKLRKGYGVTNAGIAHRVAYLLVRGDIPDGLHLDHLCRNRACVNPDHLEPVTVTENNRRSAEFLRTQRGTCANGHPLSESFFRVTSRNGRPRRSLRCRLCHRAEYARYAHKVSAPSAASVAAATRSTARFPTAGVG